MLGVHLTSWAANSYIHYLMILTQSQLITQKTRSLVTLWRWYWKWYCCWYWRHDVSNWILWDKQRDNLYSLDTKKEDTKTWKLSWWMGMYWMPSHKHSYKAWRHKEDIHLNLAIRQAAPVSLGWGYSILSLWAQSKGYFYHFDWLVFYIIIIKNPVCNAVHK